MPQYGSRKSTVMLGKMVNGEPVKVEESVEWWVDEGENFAEAHKKVRNNLYTRVKGTLKEIVKDMSGQNGVPDKNKSQTTEGEDD